VEQKKFGILRCTLVFERKIPYPISEEEGNVTVTGMAEDNRCHVIDHGFDSEAFEDEFGSPESIKFEGIEPDAVVPDTGERKGIEVL